MSIYNRALDPTEIAAIYAADGAGKCRNRAPVIQTQPRSVAALAGSDVTLRVEASGESPLQYQWHFADGTPVPGATDATLTFTNVQVSDAGAYYVGVTNSYGGDISSNALLSVLETNDFDTALNSPGLVWTNTGDAPWFIELATRAPDGLFAMRSGPITDNELSALQTTVVGPGTIAFWWRVSSERNYDWLLFSVDGTVLNGWSGEMDWRRETFVIPAGTNVLEWTYTKDFIGYGGNDAGWLDEVMFTPTNGPAMLLVHQSEDQTFMVGDPRPVEFGATAAGVDLAYQWQHDRTDLAAATNAWLVLQPVKATDAGEYSVTITNTFGHTNSPPALLTLLPFEWQWQQSVGGDEGDDLYAAAAAGDAGFVLVGDSESGATGSKASTNAGASDAWVVELDADGNRLWDRSYDGTNNEQFNAVVTADDGGFLLVGDSSSGPSGNKTNVCFGTTDGWVVRTDADGHKLWDRSFGGTGTEWLYAAKGLPDGGIILAGASDSLPGGLGNKTSPNFGDEDFWLVRLDANGALLWDYTFGGSGGDELWCLLPTADGGVVCGGISGSDAGEGNKTSPAFGMDDCWALKLKPLNTVVPPITLLDPAVVGTEFRFSFQTQSNRDYSVEYTDRLAPANWRLHHTMTGNGSMMPCVIPLTNSAQRFFRVRQP